MRGFDVYLECLRDEGREVLRIVYERAARRMQERMRREEELRRLPIRDAVHRV